MSKTSFSKSQLTQLHTVLAVKEMLPCDYIRVYTDNTINCSGVYNVINFVKGKKQLNVGFITKTDPKNEKLRYQLYKYFGGEE